MKKLLFILCILTSTAEAQERVVSLDYCADQYVIALVEPERIAGVSPAAGSKFSYLADRSKGLPRLRPTGEQVLLADPDIVVRQWGGGYNAAAYLDRFAIPVAQVGFGNDIDAIRTNLGTLGAALGATDKAEQLIEDMDTRLARIRARHVPESDRPRALYLTPGGATSGAGTFIHEMLVSAGVTNMGAEGGKEGWQHISLEAIVLDPPDLIVGAFFDLEAHRVNYWSIARHSFVKDMMEKIPTVLIPGSQASCSAWFFVDAVEAIHAVARPLMPQKIAAQP